MSLTEVQFERYQQLLRRPFLVLDTEYTHAPKLTDANEGSRERLISVGVVPVVRGARSAAAELYVEMNPGVPITPETTKVHGFTDDAVAGKRPFSFYGRRIVEALSVEDAVLVTHTAGDTRILSAELERTGLPQLPDLPLLDTSVLPRQLRYPGITGRGFVSLATLAGLTLTTNASPHHARSDARATADALLALLRHAAADGRYLDIDELLSGVTHGTARSPKTGAYIRSSRTATPLPSEHLAEHTAPLTHAGTPEELDAWVVRAQRCVALRCEHLATETALAVQDNGATLLGAVTELLTLAELPGQAGTVAGALRVLIAPGEGAATGALKSNLALRWWAPVRTRIEAVPPCGTRPDERCPTCRAGEGCPLDTLYLPVADLALRGGAAELSIKRIEDRILGNQASRVINRWQLRNRKELAYALWVVANWLFERKSNAYAQDALRQAAQLGLPLLEPRLALLQCEALASNSELDEALRLADRALEQRTTDPAYTELDAWVVWQRQAHTQPSRPPRNITHPRLARPRTRRNANPYLP